MTLPNKAYYTLDDLEKAWSTSDTNIKEWLVSGELEACVPMPMMSAYELSYCSNEQTPQLMQTLRHWEGYAALSRHTCQRLFKSRQINIREFNCSQSQARLSLPETAMDITISSDEILVLAAEKARFEQAHNLVCRSSDQANQNVPACKSEPPKPEIIADPSFRVVRVDGEDYSFGEIQSRVFRLLHKAALDGEPWQHGKQLLKEAGSVSFSLPNIYRRREIWRQLVISDGQGNYRLSTKCSVES